MTALPNMLIAVVFFMLYGITGEQMWAVWGAVNLAISAIFAVAFRP